MTATFPLPTRSPRTSSIISLRVYAGAIYRLLVLGTFTALAIGLTLPGPVFGQIAASGQAVSPTDTTISTIRIDGEPVRTLAVSNPDSLRARAEAVIDSLHQAGYLAARMDTLAYGLYARVAELTRGPQAEVGEIKLVGMSEERERYLRGALRLGVGEPFSPQTLEQDIRQILSLYAAEGHFLARASVEQLRHIDSDAPRIGITIRIHAGPVLKLKRIDLLGGSRTSATLVARMTGLRLGEPLTGFEPSALRQALVDAGFFEDVGEPDLVIEADSGAVLRIPIDEGDPGAFDILLGYLPPTIEGERGRVIGSGHLQLQNPFGGGRSLTVRLNRLPGQASSVDVELASPFVLGLPLGIAGRFHGLEQDSTYGKQEYAGEVRYYVAGGFDLIGGFSREITSPGQAGLRLNPSGRQIVPGAEAWFIGLGVSIQRIDRLRNPTRGLLVEMNLESGRKRRSERRIIDADTTRESLMLEQQRLRARARLYAPTLRRQVLVIGGDAGLLVSSEYDRSDLFRFGGAMSLRGYDEDRFLGRLVGRALVEYRLLIDRYSFAYAFFDLGYVDRPATPDLTAVKSLHPGYGIGIQFDTAIGLVNVSAALNPEGGPTDARIHAGLSFGL